MTKDEPEPRAGKQMTKENRRPNSEGRRGSELSREFRAERQGKFRGYILEPRYLVSYCA